MNLRAPPSVMNVLGGLAGNQSLLWGRIFPVSEDAWKAFKRALPTTVANTARARLHREYEPLTKDRLDLGRHAGVVPPLVVADQLIDLTKRRASTFFEDGVVAHVVLRRSRVRAMSAASLADAAERARARGVHRAGRTSASRGPQFSTRAESLLYRSWGVSVIGMTAMPEAKLAREAELPYALLALATDYDCWHESEEDVTSRPSSPS